MSVAGVMGKPSKCKLSRGLDTIMCAILHLPISSMRTGGLTPLFSLGFPVPRTLACRLKEEGGKNTEDCYDDIK